VAATLLAGACAESTGSSGTVFSPALVNLGLAAQSSELAADGDLVLVAAREFQGGGRDLDQDGDAFDLVVFVVDLESGTARNTGLALDTSAPALAASVRDDLALFAASEQASGGRDLNGDGDADDAVAFVHDRRDGSTRGLALALSRRSEPALGGDLAAFAVSEADQGVDLDGDGGLDDDVLHVYDRATRALVNTGLDAPSRLFLEDGQVAHLARERGADLNGDGDRLDAAVLAVLDVASGTSQGSALATDGGAPVFAGGTWLVAVPETAQGRDLDGDGERLDAVAFTADLATGMARSLGQEAVDLRASRDFLLLARRENAAGVDWNGDGDRADVVVHVFDPRTGRTTNTRMASADVFGASAEEVLLYVDETGEGEDLNGDRDRADLVFVLFDLVQERARSVALAGGFDQARFGSLNEDGRLLLLANERAQGRDLDGDGDLLDDVLHRGR
jgi:hypothetical protein